jgi:hypothetical protein
MHSFIAYGLSIQSEMPLLDFQPLRHPPDVFIRLGNLANNSIERKDNGGFLLFAKMPGVAAFLVSEGRNIVVDPEPGVSEALLRSAILASAMSVILRQRGLLVLHGSCVAINGQAIAFLGHSGWGKSTLASALHHKGYALLTDDVLAVHLDSGQAWVRPSFPLVKLWPEAAIHTGKTHTKTTQIRPELSKNIHEINENFTSETLPLRQIYVLAKSEHNEIIPLRGKEAFVELVRHSRTAMTLIQTAFVQKHFRQCSELTQCTGISRLSRQYKLDQMPDVIKLVEQDIMPLSGRIDSSDVLCGSLANS